MGEKLRLQSCRADVRVKCRGGELEIKVLRYRSLVDFLSVDEGGNGSESKSKKFNVLNWEGYEQQRWFCITMSDGKKHTFKLKQVPAAAAGNIFWVTPFDESQDLFPLNESLDVNGVLNNVNIDLIELIQILAEAPKKVPVATYNSNKKTLRYSKSELGSGGIRSLASIVGRTRELGFNKTPFDGHFLGVVGDIRLWDFHNWFYAKVAGFSVEGDDVMVWLTTDGIKTKGKYAKEKVEALNNVESGEYHVGIMEASSAAGIDVLLVDEPVIGLANGRSRVGFRAKDARRLSFDAATETISSVLSNKYIEGMIDAPQLGIKLRLKTKSGDWVVAMDKLERNGLMWRGEALSPVNFSSDDIVGAFLSSGSDTPLLNFPGWEMV